MYIDCVKKGNKVTAWLRDTSGSLIETSDDIEYYCYQTSPEGEFSSMFGDKASKHSFAKQEDYDDFRKENAGSLWESDFSPVEKFLSDNFYKVEGGNLHIGLFDIEVDFDLADDRGYPTPSNPFGPINAITLYKEHTKKFHLIYVSEYRVDIDQGKDAVISHQCTTERQLLDTFFKIMDDVDLVSGWNSSGYDLPYIVLRSKLLYGDFKAKAKMCRGGFLLTERRKKDNFGNDVIKYDLVGRSHLDMLELFRKFIPGERPSFSLENVAQEELGYGKIQYDGDLGGLYRTDRKTFLEYNVHDVKLLRDLENKHKLIKLAINMGKSATIRYCDVLGSIKYLENSIRNYAHFDRNPPIVLPDKVDSHGSTFAGGFVVDTKPGIYGWVMSVDLAALYPSTIRALNISPETHIFQLGERHDGFLAVVNKSNDKITLADVRSGDEMNSTGAEVSKLLVDNNLTISANGSIFTNDFCGLIPEVLGVWAAERKTAREKSREFFKTGDKTNAEQFDLVQSLKKLSSNSLYGAISNAYCRFYSRDLALSVTLTGQEIAKFQNKMADQLVKKHARR